LLTGTPLWRFIYDRYEPDVWTVIRDITGELAVDVGANIGQYTIPLASRFRRVLAIEPGLSNCSILSRNISRHGLVNVEIHRVAIADFDGETRMRSDPEYSLNMGMSESGQPSPVCRLDSLLKDEERIDLVKVDVEGAEWKVLDGARSIMPRIQRWLIELHNASRTGEFDSLLHSYGYDANWVKYRTHTLPHVLASRPSSSSPRALIGSTPRA
jgi:FkbM family methyltransferase